MCGTATLTPKHNNSLGGFAEAEEKLYFWGGGISEEATQLLTGSKPLGQRST